MTKVKKVKSRERAYSYAEYLKSFYPKSVEIPQPFSEPESLQRVDPKTVGTALALESLERAKRDLQKQH